MSTSETVGDTAQPTDVPATDVPPSDVPPTHNRRDRNRRATADGPPGAKPVTHATVMVPPRDPSFLYEELTKDDSKSPHQAH